MAKRHGVFDSDTHFLINATTRTMRNEGYAKAGLIQNDHNSERFTFEIPRVIEGHDMTKCDVVQVHYDNVGWKGIYEVKDMQISPEDPDVVVFSWLISGNATKSVGTLEFSIRFMCLGNNNEIEYAWNTATYSNINVSKGVYNSEVVTEKYIDVLQQWKSECVDPLEQRVSTLEEYMKMVIKPTLTFYSNWSDYWGEDDVVPEEEGCGNYDYGVLCTINRAVTDVAGLETTDDYSTEYLDDYHYRNKITSLQMGDYVILYVCEYSGVAHWIEEAIGCSYKYIDTIEIDDDGDHEYYNVYKITNIGNDAVIKLRYSE